MLSRPLGQNPSPKAIVAIELMSLVTLLRSRTNPHSWETGELHAACCRSQGLEPPQYQNLPDAACSATALDLRSGPLAINALRQKPQTHCAESRLEGLVEPNALSRKEDPTTKPACSVVVRGPVWWTQRRSSCCCAMQEHSSWMRARVRHQMGRRVVHEVLRIPPSTCEGVSAGLDSQRTCP